MTKRRRLNFLGCLLALVLLSGTLPSSSALWQCRHASRVVSLPFTASSAAMPCRQSDVPMPGMACCSGPTSAVKQAPLHPASLTTPPCRPLLLRLAILPCAHALAVRSSPHPAFSSANSALPPSRAFLPPVPEMLPLKQRPPPTSGRSHFSHFRMPGLRAPPAA